MINFLKYDPATGKILSKGFMDNDIINQLSLDGNPIIKFDGGDIDIMSVAYDIENKKIIPIQPEPQTISVPKTISFIEFMGLFTGPEKMKIVSSVDPEIKLFTLMASGAGVIPVNSDGFINGINYLFSMGILTEERKNQIINLQPPQ